MKVVIYTKDNCSFCVSAKQMFDMKNIQYEERKLGRDIVREDFIALFPEQKTLPLIFINDAKVGGYNEAKRYFDSKKLS